MANNILLASDNFASGSLAAGWALAVSSAFTRVCKVVAGSPNVTESQALSESDGQMWTGLSWPVDHSSEITLQGFTNEVTTQFQLLCRFQASGASFSGYIATISNNGGNVKSWTAGVATTLNTLSGLTVAAGDVWTLQAAGPFVTLYKNGKLISQGYDTNYQSWASVGCPGFGQYSNQNIAHCQVSAWRGYSAVQQDGIWQKQGITIPAIALDFSSTGSGCATCSQILYEGNAQILSGTVYKIWFCGQQPATNDVGYIAYAESTDGINWTRYTGGVLAGYLAPTIWKQGSTYYMLAQPNTGAGTGAFAAFTSSDGIHWTLQNATALSPGGAGTWDHTGFWQFGVVAVIGGTWYGIYTAGGASQTYYANAGLATSTDGINWTKYVSNPVQINFGFMQAFFTPDNGTTYYLWGGETSLGRGGSKPNLDPTEAVRYKVTNNFTTWTNRTPASHNSEMFEYVNGTAGGAWINSVININGNTYAYTTEGPDGNTPPAYSIGLQIASATLANIIQENEDAVQQLASDAFTSGLGNLDSNWTTPTGYDNLQIVSGNLVQAGTLNADNGAIFTGDTFPANQYSEITIATLTNGFNAITPTVRASVSGNMYFCALAGGSPYTSLSINKLVSGTVTILSPVVDVTASVGDVFRLQVVTGSDGFPVLSFFQNGFLLLQVQDYGNSLTSGSPGVYAYAQATLADAQISEWAGGNANVMPFGIISGNAGVAGALVSYSGPISGSVTADGSGNYALPNLANGSYTVTPSLTGYSFSPTSASETISNGNISGVNFTATQLQVATPTFSPVAGTYTSIQTVTVSDTNSGLSGFAMYYTLDGSTPTTGSMLYTVPITVSTSETIKVLAVATGYANSNIGSAAYIINLGVPTGNALIVTNALLSTGLLVKNSILGTNALIPITSSIINPGDE